MGTRYPEIYRIDEHGRRHEHGIRAEASLTNPVYQALVDRIVTKLAERYGDEPPRVGLADRQRARHVRRLQRQRASRVSAVAARRYGDVDRMNAAWGGSFWSSRYAQLRRGADSRTRCWQPRTSSARTRCSTLRGSRPTPRRSSSIARSTILKRHAARAVGHDQLHQRHHGHRSAPQPALDFLTFTLYPVAGAQHPRRRQLRHRRPDAPDGAAAYYRPITGTFGIMELQPGQVNWGAVNPQPAAGRRPHVDPARLRAPGRRAEHLPLPPSAARQRDVPRRHRRHRRRDAVTHGPRVRRDDGGDDGPSPALDPRARHAGRAWPRGAPGSSGATTSSGTSRSSRRPPNGETWAHRNTVTRR